MRKREIAARILGSKFARRVWSLSGAKGRGLRILAYHRVIDDDPRNFAFDEELISADTETFHKQMKFVRSNFDVISFQDMLRCELEGRELPDRPLLITFDDGYRDNYTNAFPVLKEFGLPATIFLTSGHINRSKLFWWDAIAYSLKHTEREGVTFPEISPEPMRLGSPAERRCAIENILFWIKQTPEEIKQDFLENLSKKLDVALPDHLADGMTISWEEAKSMAACGIEFGSHTVNHPILANVSHEQLEKEISESKKIIEQNLGREIIVFAYPVGGRLRFNETAQKVVAQCGFRYAVSYEGGLACDGAVDRYSMPRIHVEREHSLNLFRANLMFPQVMFRRAGDCPEQKDSSALPAPYASV